MCVCVRINIQIITTFLIRMILKHISARLGIEWKFTVGYYLIRLWLALSLSVNLCVSNWDKWSILSSNHCIISTANIKQAFDTKRTLRHKWLDSLSGLFLGWYTQSVENPWRKKNAFIFEESLQSLCPAFRESVDFHFIFKSAKRAKKKRRQK